MFSIVIYILFSGLTISEELPNQFDSLTKTYTFVNSKPRKILTKDILSEEVEQQQKMFDTMKEELYFARQKNFEKRLRSRNIQVFKRNVSPATTSTIPTDLEKRIDARFQKEKGLIPKAHHKLLLDSIRHEEEKEELRNQHEVEKEKLRNNLTTLQTNLTNMKKVLNKIGVINHYRVIIERFNWNYCTMNSNISAKAKKIKNLRDDFIPSNLIWDRENAKEDKNEKKLQKAYDNIASFNRRYQMTVATIKHSKDRHVAVFVTQLEKELKRKLSAHEIGLLVASFYSGLSQIDHNDDLKDDINWEDEEAIKTALKSWKFDGEILDLAIAFHRFNVEI